jgi:phage tail tape-measure protein
MTCQTLRDAIVDIARGAETGQGTRAAVECHLDHCEACATLMARERQLSRGLRALAASTSGDGASEAMGRRLREMFAEGQGVGATAEARREPATGRWTAWAAAATIVVAAGGAAWYATTATPPPIADSKPPVLASTESPAATVPTSSPVETPATDRAEKPAKRPRPTPPARYAVATGFVALPSAVGLPDFESGQIIRMELPLTSLPTYGIEIAPDARDRSVEADLLVGQDGQARAIRLVTGGGN